MGRPALQQYLPVAVIDPYQRHAVPTLGPMYLQPGHGLAG
jgi:hypothetical protein